MSEEPKTTDIKKGELFISPSDRAQITSSTYEDRERDSISKSGKSKLKELQSKYDLLKDVSVFRSLSEATQVRLDSLKSTINPKAPKKRNITQVKTPVTPIDVSPVTPTEPTPVTPGDASVAKNIEKTNNNNIYTYLTQEGYIRLSGDLFMSKDNRSTIYIQDGKIGGVNGYSKDSKESLRWAAVMATVSKMYKENNQ